MSGDVATGATLKDVAERAGVHPGTASRALNPLTQGLVSEATVRRVQAAAKALAYRPNSIARGLKTNRTMTVGIVVPDLSNPVFAPMVRGAAAVLTQAGYSSVIADTDNDPVKEAEAFDTLRSRQVDGLLVASARREDAAVRALADAGVPTVLLNRRTDRTTLPCVMGDDVWGMEQAVRHLRALGHTRIGHLSGPVTMSTGVERARAFRQFMLELGGDLDPELLEECVTYSVGEGARTGRLLLDRARPTAIIAGNDQIAVGLLDVLEERGLRCPEDVSVVGYNDMPFVDKLSPPLTTVHVPHSAIGAEGSRILLRWLRDGASATTTLSLGVDLVARGSTAPVPEAPAR
ncbi:LacI family transcriptional regulator [Actinotalea ferrariae CF5-4]|uniref:LacI family transcriptional regulator n=1 Tax=Actinotalea ferrariae CF5-4 TaxID=948458 RepID=A0A021VSA8_9CELL|nr:LacI family DNA-binding transcriptional regulator [Actinotalea ferrariae]EYR64089.1 LacI family transcriptional regulator [Actinotalea ferrariae CF5-4]